MKPPRRRARARGATDGWDSGDLDGGPGSSDSDAGPAELAVVFEDVAAELADIRGALAYDFDEADMFFDVHVRGGRWTMVRNAAAAGSGAGYALRGLATDWCKICKFPWEASFQLNRNGSANANQLAREFCRRVQFFFLRWLVSDEGDFKYTDKHQNANEKSYGWVSFMSGFSIDDVSFIRDLEIRKLVPSSAQAEEYNKSML